MKLIKPLIFTLFFITATTMRAAEDNSPENSDPTPTNSETEEIDRPVPEISQQRQADLAKAQNTETEIIWLDLNGTKQLALLQRAATASPAGTVIIFPDPSTGADWPTIVHPLRTQLTEFGWNTMSITLPELPPAAVPKRTLPALQNKNQIQTGTENSTNNQAADPQPVDSNNQNGAMAPENSSNSSEAQPAIAEYNKLITELGQQAESQLNAIKGDIRVILGVGEGATWAMTYFMQNETQPDRYLVLLAPSPVMAENAPDLLQMMAATKAPVLDLWFNSGRYEQERATLRKRTARRSGNRNYLQFRLNQRSNDPRREPLWLTQQVRGILKTHILDAQKPEHPVPEATELTPGS